MLNDKCAFRRVLLGIAFRKKFKDLKKRLEIHDKIAFLSSRSNAVIDSHKSSSGLKGK